ncbi:STAS domain-containing protein [Pontibacillus sp. HMF3514]|uniref:STAS domain-containing protein n=1 Tax=Pontibacillus sp. HMF3514 TaxID=2692425 RepID=UPI00131F82D3|nr:STAS domain-containing protein [Pontibacillus sp. HMF3514]QHE52680.1 STAS domain-containing protein [Pontibacillus sp. HMF3514]
MANKYNIESSEFQSLKTASKKMFKLITNQLNVNTAYVARRGDTAMTVLSSFNQQEEMVPEGFSLEYSGTYCRLVIQNENEAISIVNGAKDELTRELEVTSDIGTRGFLGVTLSDAKENVFGTLCVLDKEEKDFSNEDIDYLKSMAEVLSYIIELDQTKYNMAYLSVPIIPITKGVSVLSIQGIIDENRAADITNTVLQYGSKHQMDYFIIDMSGLVILDNDFPPVIITLVKSLQLMGIETIITGISPEIAKHEVNNMQFKELNAKKVPDLESALEYIGFYLAEKEESN